MRRVLYTYEVDGSVVSIDDLDGGRSVYSQIEVVLAEIEAKTGSLKGKYIIWRGHRGLWDLLLPGAKRSGFGMAMYPLGIRTLTDAKAKIRYLLAQGIMPI